MLRKILSLASVLLLFSGALSAQNKVWKETNDSLAVLLKERGGITVEVEIKSVLRRNEIDVYFTDKLKDYPWREGDVEWFKDCLYNLLPNSYKTKCKKVGKVYAKAQLIEQLVMEDVGNDGKPVSDRFRTTDYRNSTTPLVQRCGMPEFNMGLQNRHIAVWHSHGLYYNFDHDRWMWQRAPLFTTVEDVYTMSYVLPFLVPMLENAGANVLLPRERDYSTEEYVAEAEGNKWNVEIAKRGNYAVYVSYNTTSNSSEKAHYTVHHLGGSTEFDVNQKMAGGIWVYLGNFDFDKGIAEISLENKDGSNSTVSAGKVKIGGGVGESGQPRFIEAAKYWLMYSGVDSTVWDQNKNEHDYRDDFMCRGAWVDYLSSGSHANPGQFIPPKDGNDKQPANRDGLNIPIDLSLAFHTDAGVTPNDSIVGTLAIYTRIIDGKHTFANGENRLNQRMYADMVQTQIVNDLRSTYNEEWSRRQIWDRSYSESRTPGVPAMLLELLSHQNFGDMKYGLDPGFRFTVSRSVYKGMLKFLSDRYGCSYVVQPLPVHCFSASFKDKNTVKLTWEPTEDPLEPTATSDRYYLYTRIDDGGFDNGVLVESNEIEVTIEPDHIYSWKVAAANDGGLSFPSETLAAGRPSAADLSHNVVVVNNFTRTGGPIFTDTETYAGFNSALESGVPYINYASYIGEMYEWRRDRRWTSDDAPGFGASFNDGAGKVIAGNTFDFVYEHGKHIFNSGHSFSSCSSEWFCQEGRESIWAVDLICGKQMTCAVASNKAKFSVFPEELQDEIVILTASGTNFIVSGAYIGTDLWDPFWPTDYDEDALDKAKVFAENVLGYKLITSHATRSGNVSQAASRKAPVMESNIGTFHYNNSFSDSIYCVESSDAIGPSNGKGTSFLRYSDNGVSAGVCCNFGRYRTACLGFPIETITDEEAKSELMSSILNYFEKK